MCDLDTTGASSIFKIIRNVTDFVRMLLTFDLSGEENTVRLKWNWSRSVRITEPELLNL